MEAFRRRDAGFGKRCTADEHVVGGERMEPGLHSCMERGVGLWVEIDQADVLPRPGQRHREVHRCGRLADPTLLIGHGDRAHRR